MPVTTRSATRRKMPNQGGDEVEDQEEVTIEKEHIQPLRPKYFSGEKWENVNEFIKNYRRTAKANKWSDDTKLLQLPCFLKGAALDWFETIEEDYTEFEEVIEQLKSIFTNANHEEQLHYRLSTRVQQKGEDVWKYYHEMLRLCKEVSPEMQETEKIRFVLKGLQPKILEKVNLMNNATLEDLRNNIRKVEATSFLLGHSSQEPGPSTSTERDEISRLREQISRLESRLQGRNFSNYTSYKKASQPVQVKKESGRTQDGRVICFNCNKPGHYAKNCFAKNSRNFTGTRGPKN